ncbi:GNAT family N-acyltransferase [Streptomyces sp. TRM 70361]|uniref:GNAT family N-acetyltransferase n=1 Tax=Streptomyces sp. TRM 70361 TaxID=3116553 RepID=UPI002E7BFA00|nr:GNAT family N-acyltransferase [Streptomyces sp. TRM 70361]MEE1942860.1 GNAT family N-acyltransferase [Streptomyces sp. TRM 70361]
MKEATRSPPGPGGPAVSVPTAPAPVPSPSSAASGLPAVPRPAPVPAVERSVGDYVVGLARDEADVRAAQRLRHRVFAGELGARLATADPGLDIDGLDAHCDHLLVRERRGGQVVGTYRLLPPGRARAAGRLYAEDEFELDGLLDGAGLRGDLVEAGRSCVHPDHRDGAVIALMWAGIARYLVRTGHNWLGGCCSLPLDDGGALAAGAWEVVSARHMAPAAHRVRPRRPWDPGAVERAPRAGSRAALPPLLRGYLRLGAKVCGPPAHDPDFGVADLYVLLSLRDTAPRYLRHFLSLLPE